MTIRYIVPAYHPISILFVFCINAISVWVNNYAFPYYIHIRHVLQNSPRALLQFPISHPERHRPHNFPHVTPQTQTHTYTNTYATTHTHRQCMCSARLLLINCAFPINRLAHSLHRILLHREAQHHHSPSIAPNCLRFSSRCTPLDDEHHQLYNCRPSLKLIYCLLPNLQSIPITFLFDAAVWWSTLRLQWN